MRATRWASRVIEEKPKPESREAKHKPKLEELIESAETQE